MWVGVAITLQGVQAHLVDATYELFRMYFGAPPHTSPSGQENGAVRGLCATLLYLCGPEGATHLGCATDRVIRSFRNELFDGYKTDEGVPSELMEQFPLAEEAIEALGITLWPMVEFEADDALASAAAKFAPEVDRVVIATPDKDLAQCVRGEQVVMLDRRRDNKILDEPGVVEKFGVLPQSIPDFLALVGDAADGYPGLAGWGKKSTATVLGAYPSIEEIPLDASTWTVKVRGAAKLAATLAEQRDDALLYKRLATLRLDAPIPEALDELEWRGARRTFEAFCVREGFSDMPGRVTRWLES